MFDRVLNAPLAFLGIAILRFTFAEDLFILKLQIVCLRCFWENSVTDSFFRILQIFSSVATFQNSGQLLQISQEIIVISLLSFFNFFLKACFCLGYALVFGII